LWAFAVRPPWSCFRSSVSSELPFRVSMLAFSDVPDRRSEAEAGSEHHESIAVVGQVLDDAFRLALDLLRLLCQFRARRPASGDDLEHRAPVPGHGHLFHGMHLVGLFPPIRFAHRITLHFGW